MYLMKLELKIKLNHTSTIHIYIINVILNVVILFLLSLILFRLSTGVSAMSLILRDFFSTVPYQMSLIKQNGCNQQNFFLQ